LDNELRQFQDVNPEKANKVLAKLNSFDSIAEMTRLIGVHDEQHAFGKRMAQRILNMRREVGHFRDLNQVAMVPGIGNKRLAIIICSLGGSSATC
jgi:hypothetical protein